MQTATSIKIATCDNSDLFIEPEWRNEVFAVHREVRMDNSLGSRYVLTHIKTGYCVTSHNNREALIAIAEKLLKYDWNFTSPRSKKIKPLAKVVEDIRRAHD